ncbi:hypothetical protein DYB25_003449 [Aphanomyces astaci]|uniref:Large ribosomal subunit protein uL29m n=2 Tax=Aphanomyces astaci TaxID=112090 RepID=A0A397CAV9_APHAT|nr:hypothetical protein DYB36_001640 [Aphanomyces astaci]RHY22497.1 hypothetical protein DYB25_003449 [Aphanomyces astaci]RHY42918.1 hypothetical protein DYB38_012109 [Aphanomyces astaci]RHY76469.1 hypothetical protein DYB34_004094 [Aphanomyces astaci]RHZ19202.1 hypothetical protein DYB31_011314 [Aphanomyces astaci]
MLRRVLQVQTNAFTARSISSSATLFAKPSASGAATAKKAALTGTIDQFFPTSGVVDGKKVKRGPPVVGGDWKAWMLRNKSTDDLHKLWYVLLKERNALLTEQAECHTKNMVFPNPFRKSKVRKSMARIKLVLHERSNIYQHNLAASAPPSTEDDEDEVKA